MEHPGALGTSGASSFDAAGFLEAQQAAAAQTGAAPSAPVAAERRAALLHAAQGLLSSSSDGGSSSGDDSGSDSPVGANRHAAGGSGSKRQRGREGGDDRGGEKRRRAGGEKEEKKRSRSRRSRSRSRDRRRRGSSGKRDKRSSDRDKRDRSKTSHRRRGGRSELEKIAEAERRAAAAAAAAAARAGGLLGPLGLGLGGGSAAAAFSLTLPGQRLPQGQGQMEWLLDTKGDPANLSYQSLYARDVPRYTRLDPLNLLGDTRLRYAWQREAAAAAAADREAGAQTRVPRYFSGRAAAAERDKRAKRLRLGAAAGRWRGGGVAAASRDGFFASSSGGISHAAGGQMQPPALPPPPPYIPLSVEGDGSSTAAAAAATGMPAAPQGESAEEYVLRRTREWNVAVRERPRDESLWLGFAAFQEAAARSLGRRVHDASPAEKQVAILQHGLEHCPGSERLLLALLRAFAGCSEPEALHEKWEAVLARWPGSWLLWRGYLAARLSHFGSFRPTALEPLFARALHNLTTDLSRLRRSRLRPATPTAAEVAAESACEERLVQVALAGVLFLIDAGCTEAAVGTMQAILEFHCFAPLPGPSASPRSVLRDFLVFWSSGAPRVGEPGAKGWCAWAQDGAQGGSWQRQQHESPQQQQWQQQPPPQHQPPMQQQQQQQHGGGGGYGHSYGGGGRPPPLPPPPLPSDLPPPPLPTSPPPPVAGATAAAAAAAAGSNDPSAPQGWGGWFAVPNAAAAEAAMQGAPLPIEPPPREGEGDESPPPLLPGSPPGSPEGSPAGPKAPDILDSEEDGGGAADSDQQQQRETSERGEGEKDEEEGDGEEGEGMEVDGARDEGAPPAEEEEAAEEVDELELMLQLGIKMEERLDAMQAEGITPEIMERWVEEESSRSRDHWRPLRPGSQHAAASADPDQDPDHEEPDPLKEVRSDRVEPFLFDLESSAARRRLVLGCLELLGAPLGDGWCCSNAPTPAQQRRLGGGSSGGDGSFGAGSSFGGGSAALLGSGGDGRGSGLQALEAAAAAALGGDEFEPGGSTAAAFAAAVAAAARGTCWFDGSPERWQFLRTVLESLIDAPAATASDARRELGAALLALHTRRPRSGDDDYQQPDKQQQGKQQQQGAVLSQQEAEAAREAAKQLLSRHRGDLSLFAAYARLEAAAGNTKAARRVYESALALGSEHADTGGHGSGSSGSIGGSSYQGAAGDLLLLALEFADFELSAGGGSSEKGGGAAAAAARAEAALAAALGGIPYRPPAAASKGSSAAGGATSTAAAAARLAARRGFQEAMPRILSAGGGALDAAGAAAVAAAATLELIAGAADTGDPSRGLSAAQALLRNVASAVPAATCRASPHHERLAVRSCALAVAAALGRPPPGLLAAAASTAAVPAVAVRAPAKRRLGGGGGATAYAPVVPPAAARAALKEALELYPQNTTLISLLIELETSSFTLTRLRRELSALRARAPSPAAWLAAAAAEATRPGGRARLRAMLEAAVSGNRPDSALPLPPPPPPPSGEEGSRGGASDCYAASSSAAEDSPTQQLAFWDTSEAACVSCPALWRLRICWELSPAARPRSNPGQTSAAQADAARKLLLRAVHECPGAKGLWLSGLKAVASGVGPRELSGLMSAMQERLLIRTDALEVMLAALDAEGLAAEGLAGGGDGGSVGDGAG